MNYFAHCACCRYHGLQAVPPKDEHDDHAGWCWVKGCDRG